ncbi:MAG: type II toxin-antitoxin system HicB family antitoxin [Candidatus Zapsychrus exili]|nr:type II toxin-antitoxin system HicB family antitoxin [Candidatus Zapsychrus exili]
MKDIISYKEYLGSVHYSDEDQVFYGKLEFIKALVTYEGNDVKSLKKAFEESVDDYLELCAKKNIVSEKPLKGSFNVRAGEILHREAYVYANEHDLNLNQVVVNALETYLSKA